LPEKQHYDFCAETLAVLAYLKFIESVTEDKRQLYRSLRSETTK